MTNSPLFTPIIITRSDNKYVWQHNDLVDIVNSLEQHDSKYMGIVELSYWALNTGMIKVYGVMNEEWYDSFVYYTTGEFTPDIDSEDDELYGEDAKYIIDCVDADFKSFLFNQEDYNEGVEYLHEWGIDADKLEPILECSDPLMNDYPIGVYGPELLDMMPYFAPAAIICKAINNIK